MDVFDINGDAKSWNGKIGDLLVCGSNSVKTSCMKTEARRAQSVCWLG
jgi:hypothetical protein